MKQSLKRIGGTGYEHTQQVGNFEVRFGKNKKQYRILNAAIEKYLSLIEPGQIWDLSSSKPILLEEKAFVETKTTIDRTEADEL